jgi:hypothetical protein
MTNINGQQLAALSFVVILVVGLLGWTGSVKIWGWGKASTQEASAMPSRMSDYERSGRAYPSFSFK